jgi:dTDP-glucose 4,6-dehydratase
VKQRFLIKIMQNILITGGAGFIGSNFIRYMLRVEGGGRLTNLDALTYAGSLENLKAVSSDHRYSFVRGNICDGLLVADLLRQHKINTVVHFAAESHVDRSIYNPGQFITTNVVGTQTLLDACRQVWLEEKLLPLDQVRFHHVSTDEVYGSLQPNDPAFSEATPYAPNSPYAASKAASDHLVRAYYHTYGLPITVTNCSNNYGPYQFPEKLIPLMILNGIAGKSLPLYGDGQQIRDWLYVEDHCEAIELVLLKGRNGETYNIGGNNQPSNLEIVHLLCDLLDNLVPNSAFKPHASLIQFVTDRPGHDRRYAIDLTKIRTELGWQPRESLTTGLRKTVEWYLANPLWIETIQCRNNYQEWLQHNYQQRGGAA